MRSSEGRRQKGLKGASSPFDLSLVPLASGWQGGQLTPIDLIVEERFHRAAPGGMGGTKAAGNYSPVRREMGGFCWCGSWGIRLDS